MVLKSRWMRQRWDRKGHKRGKRRMLRKVKGNARPHLITGLALHPFLPHPKDTWEECGPRSGPFSPVPPGSLFLRAPRAGESVPSGFIKTLVAFLHVCSIFTAVPSQLTPVSWVSVASFSLLCHNKNWWLKGCVFCYGIDEVFHVLNMILPIFLEQLPMFLNIFRL